MVNYLDTLVGRIVRKTEALGIEKNTVILFTTDNGTHKAITSKIGERKMVGGKGTTKNSGTHVPLIAYCPEKIRAGQTCRDLVDFSDFFTDDTECGEARSAKKD